MPKKNKEEEAEVLRLTTQAGNAVQDTLEKRFYVKYENTEKFYHTIEKLTSPGYVPMNVWLWVLVGKVVIEGTVRRPALRLPDVKSKLVSQKKVPNQTKFQLQFILDMYFSFTGENLWVPVLGTDERTDIAAPVTKGALEDKQLKFPRFKNVQYEWDDKKPPELTLKLKGDDGVGYFEADQGQIPKIVPGDVDQRKNEDIILKMKDNLSYNLNPARTMPLE